MSEKKDEPIRQFEAFRRALNNSPVTLLEFDTDLRFRWVYNPRIGRSPEEIIGKKIGETGTIKDVSPLKNFYEKVLETGEPQRAQITIEHYDRTAYYDIYAEPLRDNEGKIIGITSSSTDITELKLAQQSLKESEELFKTVAAAANVLVYQSNLENGTLVVYRGEEIIGYNQGEIPNSEDWWLSQIHPEDRVPTEAKFRESIKSGQDYLLEYRLKRKQGDYVTVHDTGKMIRNEQGNVVRLVGGMRDVTERKKVEQAAKDNQERLELAQRVARLGSWEYFTDSDEAFWSKGLFRIFELPPKQKGPNIAEYSKLIHPDDVKQVSGRMEKFLGTGQLGESISFDYRITLPDGSTKDLYTERMVNEVDKAGKIKRIIGIEQDITERKKAEEELYKSRELLHSIINSTDSVILARDLNEKLLLLNRAQTKLYKMTEEEALGTTPYDIYSKDVAERIIAWDKKVFSEGKSFQYEENVPINGKVRTYMTNKFPLKDSKGRIYGLGGVITDITERKQMENKLEEYSKNLEKLVAERTKQLHEKERLAAIGETAGMVGHDIRNPLQAIISELFLARQTMDEVSKYGDVSEAMESINMIQEQVDYISKIVSDLQDYARPLNPEYTITDLDQLLTKILETIIVPNRILLETEIEGNIKFKTDTTFIKRALTNLVNNAIQAMPKGGDLKIKAQKSDDFVVITVSDTGGGIPEDVKAKLFQPLVTTKSKGQGLGLAVVKRLVEGLNGKVSFESQSGKGTKFVIELPIPEDGS